MVLGALHRHGGVGDLEGLLHIGLVADMDGRYRPWGMILRVGWLSAVCVGEIFDIVSLMKGHVGDGVCIRGFRARVCSIKQSFSFACPNVTIRLDMCRV